MHRAAVENNASIALHEQRTVLRDNHCNVTRTTCQVVHIFLRGAVRRPFPAVVEHHVARISWISGYNSAVSGGLLNPVHINVRLGYSKIPVFNGIENVSRIKQKFTFFSLNQFCTPLRKALNFQRTFYNRLLTS